MKFFCPNHRCFVVEGNRSLFSFSRKNQIHVAAGLECPLLCASQNWKQKKEQMLRFRPLGLFIPRWWLLTLWQTDGHYAPSTHDSYKHININSYKHFCKWFQAENACTFHAAQVMDPALEELSAFSKCTYQIPGPSHHIYVPAARFVGLVFC